MELGSCGVMDPMLKIGTAEYFESLKRFHNHLPSGKDAELLILKGHLLVETLLEKYLHQNLPHPHALADARLSFGQKLAFVYEYFVKPSIEAHCGLRCERARKAGYARLDREARGRADEHDAARVCALRAERE